jgi:hypothetical protein
MSRNRVAGTCFTTDIVNNPRYRIKVLAARLIKRSRGHEKEAARKPAKAAQSAGVSGARTRDRRQNKQGDFRAGRVETEHCFYVPQPHHGQAGNRQHTGPGAFGNSAPHDQTVGGAAGGALPPLNLLMLVAGGLIGIGGIQFIGDVCAQEDRVRPDTETTFFQSVPQVFSFLSA